MFNPLIRFLTLALVLVLAACSPPAQTPDSWTLVPEASSVSFVTVKNGDVVEAHHFTEMSGSVSADGMAQLTIAADSLETWIDIRNERVRDILLQVTQYPTIDIAARLDQEDYADLMPGDSVRREVELQVMIAGTTRSLYGDVLVVRSATNVSVATLEPVIVDMRDFGLGDAVEALRVVASLDAITPVIPVSVILAFAPADD